MARINELIYPWTSMLSMRSVMVKGELRMGTPRGPDRDNQTIMPFVFLCLFAVEF